MSSSHQFYHLGLIGYPLGHSRSPQLHHAALSNCGLEGEYHLLAIPPDQDGLGLILEILRELRAGVWQGLNVTIPHKGTVIPFVDKLTEVAAAVGAVNTLFLDNSNSLVGDNTDVPGFSWDVSRLVGNRQGTALVLGAGGSARAVVYALATMGWRIRVLSRRVQQAEEIVDDIGRSNGLAQIMDAGELIRTNLERTDASLIVNTTPLGMYPQVEDCPWPDNLPFPVGAAVYDLVYNPLETVLLRRARQAGLPVLNGAGMLVAQAALAFSRWTGLEPPFEAMERAFFASFNLNTQGKS